VRGACRVMRPFVVSSLGSGHVGLPPTGARRNASECVPTLSACHSASRHSPALRVASGWLPSADASDAVGLSVYPPLCPDSARIHPYLRHSPALRVASGPRLRPTRRMQSGSPYTLRCAPTRPDSIRIADYNYAAVSLVPSALASPPTTRMLFHAGSPRKSGLVTKN
jgi:hypothetical protein